MALGSFIPTSSFANVKTLIIAKLNFIMITTKNLKTNW